ncbi:ABC transporter permease [Psychroflexus sediminis]|uniref:Peptide/nickel transport system permease protein n=1 Tax=Psychroflexus sediminis TaxID=470826 RepID=A0A1G7YZZ6_9FLAO|nr:ABC transporter permease [Psychroflexus sediminis]SDH02033.1 peptide/nickel transport system permease protein [Psychroflexus sediminis]
MVKKALQKTVYALFTILGVVTVIFFLFSVLPGDPAQMMLGQNETKEQLQRQKEKYGFDKSIGQQYLYYINDLSPISWHSSDESDFTHFGEDKYTGTQLFSFFNGAIYLKTPYLRTSFQRQDQKVLDIIKQTLPNTAILAVSSILIALFIGIILGIVSALQKDTWIDKSIQVLSTFGMSLPSFFSAILAAWLFGYVLKAYTGLNMTGNLYELGDFGERQVFHFENLILPAFVLGIRPLAVVIQLMRSSLLEVFQQDYIRTARAKGLNSYSVIMNHSLKNALNPVVTAISGWFASMLAGAVFVEYIFGWNGIGKEIVDALNTLDLPIIMGSVLTISIIFILINILVDIIYKLLDPRI